MKKKTKIACSYFSGKIPCEDGIDLALLIDSSKSIRKKNYRKLLREMLPTFLRTDEMANNQTRVGVATFDRDAEILDNFTTYVSHDKEYLIALIESQPIRLTFKTRIDFGLNKVSDMLFSDKGGDRTEKPNVLVVFFDGRPFPPEKVDLHKALPPLRVSTQCIILLHEKFLQFDWLRAVVFQLNLKYLHVKITNHLRVVV